jgi:RNA polymerase sigma-70 factor (ECF subfamily)
VSGAPDRFEDFYRASRQRVLAFVYLVTGDLAEAQDAVPEAFVRAWQRWPRFDPGAEPEA